MKYKKAALDMITFRLKWPYPVIPGEEAKWKTTKIFYVK